MFFGFLAIGFWLWYSFCEEQVADGNQGWIDWIIRGKRTDEEQDLLDRY